MRINCLIVTILELSGSSEEETIEMLETKDLMQ